MLIQPLSCPSISPHESSVSGTVAPPGALVARSRSAPGKRSISPISRNTGSPGSPATLDRAVPGNGALGLGIGVPIAAVTLCVPRTPGSARAMHRLGGALTLCDLGERVLGVFGQSQPVRAVSQQSADDARGELVERDQRPADCRQSVGVGVFGERLHKFDIDVGRKAQPPVLVGTGEIQDALPRATPATAACDRTRQRVADVRPTRQAREQHRKRLRALGIERYPPGPLARIPAPPRDRAQEQAQTIVVGKPQHGFAAVEGGKKGGGHEQNTIGGWVDRTARREPMHAPPRSPRTPDPVARDPLAGDALACRPVARDSPTRDSIADGSPAPHQRAGHALSDNSLAPAQRRRRITLGWVELIALVALIAALAPSVQSDGGPWSQPATLDTCSAAGRPEILFPSDAPRHGTGAGAIVWSSGFHCQGGAGPRVSAIAPGADLPGTATIPRTPAGRTLALSAPTAAAAASHGQILLAGPRTGVSGDGDLLLSEGLAGGPFTPPLATDGPASPLALTTAYLGDVALVSPSSPSGSTGAIELRIHRYYMHSFLAPVSVTTSHAVEGLTLAMDYRSDALAVWERSGAIYARDMPASGRTARSAQRVATAAPGARIAALLSDDDRAILAWSETRRGITRVFAELLRARRQLWHAATAGTLRRPGWPDAPAAASGPPDLRVGDARLDGSRVRALGRAHGRHRPERGACDRHDLLIRPQRAAHRPDPGTGGRGVRPVERTAVNLIRRIGSARPRAVCRAWDRRLPRANDLWRSRTDCGGGRIRCVRGSHHRRRSRLRPRDHRLADFRRHDRLLAALSRRRLIGPMARPT